MLSAHASLRAEVVPKKADVLVAPPAQLPLFDESAPPSAKARAAKTTAEKTAEPSRHPWIWLLQRVFAVDIMVCSRCGGALRIVKIATRPDEIARALGEQGLPRGPPGTKQTVTIHGQLALHFR